MSKPKISPYRLKDGPETLEERRQRHETNREYRRFYRSKGCRNDADILRYKAGTCLDATLGAMSRRRKR